MVCNDCKKIVVFNAFCSSKCKICGDLITTGHIPGYQICSKCSEEHNLCPQCGETHMSKCVACNDNLTDSKDGICYVCKARADKYNYE